MPILLRHVLFTVDAKLTQARARMLFNWASKHTAGHQLFHIEAERQAILDAKWPAQLEKPHARPKQRKEGMRRPASDESRAATAQSRQQDGEAKQYRLLVEKNTCWNVQRDLQARLDATLQALSAMRGTRLHHDQLVIACSSLRN
jgi:hypothetical protein